MRWSPRPLGFDQRKLWLCFVDVPGVINPHITQIDGCRRQPHFHFANDESLRTFGADDLIPV